MKVVKAEMLHFAQSYGKDANNRKMQLLLRRQKPLLRATKRIIRAAVYKIFIILAMRIGIEKEVSILPL